MLRCLKELDRCTVNAMDGDVGKVADFFLDDERWTIRYLVVKTGWFFNEREVLISPAFFREADWSTKLFHLALTKDKIRNSPSIDVDQPVSRQFESDYYGYYNYPYYWGASGVWGVGAFPTSLAPGMPRGAPELPPEEARDAHLRSAKEVTGYHIHGSDGDIGHVADFIVDDETWEVRYLVVDTSHWWMAGKSVLIAPQWATSVSWPNREVRIDLTRDAIKSSPTWDIATVVSRDYEVRLYDHFGRSVYWERAGLPGSMSGSRPGSTESTDTR